MINGIDVVLKTTIQEPAAEQRLLDRHHLSTPSCCGQKTNSDCREMKTRELVSDDLISVLVTGLFVPSKITQTPKIVILYHLLGSSHVNVSTSAVTAATGIASTLRSQGQRCAIIWIGAALIPDWIIVIENSIVV